MLTFQQLCTSLNEQNLTDIQKTYAPCDGRQFEVTSVTPVTAYAKLTGKFNTPDLRGLFLRGLNVMETTGAPPIPYPQSYNDPDGASRTVGDFQADEFKEHAHVYQYFTNSIITDMSNDKDQRKCSFGDTQALETTTAGTGAQETRPRNVSIYYYMRIN